MRGAIALLAENPRPPPSPPMVGRPGGRVRAGDYQTTHTATHAALLVVVVELGHWREASAERVELEKLPTRQEKLKAELTKTRLALESRESARRRRVRERRKMYSHSTQRPQVPP